MVWVNRHIRYAINNLKILAYHHGFDVYSLGFMKSQLASLKWYLHVIAEDQCERWLELRFETEKCEHCGGDVDDHIVVGGPDFFEIRCIKYMELN